MAHLAGVRGQAISNIESRGTDVKASTIIGIANACGVSVQWLLTGNAGEESETFHNFISSSPLGQSASAEERRILSSVPFPPGHPPPISLYEKWLIDLRSEWSPK